MASAVYNLKYKLMKDKPQLALMGELWNVFC